MHEAAAFLWNTNEVLIPINATKQSPNGEDQSETQMVDARRTYKSAYSDYYPEWSLFRHKFFMLLTAGVGGKDNTTYGGAIVTEAEFPCATLIDWVRVYKREWKHVFS